MFRWISGHDPRQYGLDLGLWTRSLVAELRPRKSRCDALTSAILKRLRRGSANAHWFAVTGPSS